MASPAFCPEAKVADSDSVLPAATPMSTRLPNRDTSPLVETRLIVSQKLAVSVTGTEERETAAGTGEFGKTPSRVAFGDPPPRAEKVKKPADSTISDRSSRPRSKASFKASMTSKSAISAKIRL